MEERKQNNADNAAEFIRRLRRSRTIDELTNASYRKISDIPELFYLEQGNLSCLLVKCDDGRYNQCWLGESRLLPDYIQNLVNERDEQINEQEDKNE